MAITRRHFLHGTGVLLALPWLESLTAGEPAGIARPPTRLVATAFSNGMIPEDWWVKGTGAGMELSYSLEPFAQLREHLLLIDGLRHEQFINSGQPIEVHFTLETGIFCGMLNKRSTTDLRMAPTFDQSVAAAQPTAVDSLVMLAESPHNGVSASGNGTDWGMLYGSRVSWKTATSSVPPICDPRLAFTRVFETSRIAEDASVLDAVRGDAARMMGSVSGEDRQRLSEYQDSVRDLERRLSRIDGPRPAGAWVPPHATAAELGAPPAPTPNITERWDMLLDVAVMALRLDRTRVVSFMFEHARSIVNYNPFVPGSGTYHEVSHDPGKNKKVLSEITRLRNVHLARFIQRLKDVQEGDGTLLDHSLVLYTSGMRTGNHDHENLPVLLFGGGSGTIRSGRAIDYTKSDKRQLNRLYLSLMQRMGSTATKYHDGDAPLEELAG